MPCYHPLHGFDVGVRTLSGKIKYQIESGSVHRVRNKQGAWTWKYVEIPCGKCIGCRLGYSRMWATRCTLEAESHSDNYFLTLTYDDLHLPMVNGCTTDGELTFVGTLVPKHLQDFLKRLRIYYKRHFNIDKIRFFACGEYGDAKKRPHYHLIIFGLPIPDLSLWYTNRSSHEKVFRSSILESIWGHGIVGVGHVSWESCAYVARYVIKKQKGPGSKEYYAQLGIYPEFVRMSRRPGIALEYYEKNKDKIYESDEIFVNRKNKVEKVKPSRYYDNKFDIDDHELMELIKSRRQSTAKASLKLKLEKTSLSKEEYLALCERNKEASAKKLIRSLHVV